MSSKDEIVQEIRAAADRSVAARLEPLAAAVTALRTGLEAVAKQVDTLSAAVPKPGGVLPEAPLLALVEKLEGPAAAPTVASSGGADWATFKEAARAIDAARTQVEVLNAYLAGASGVAHRVGLFVLKGDRIAGWKGKGFADFGGNDDAVKTIALAPADDPSVARVFAEERTVFVTPTGKEPFFSKLPGPRPALAALVPMTIKDKVAAFLYADRVDGATTAADFHAVETLTLLATLLIDTLATRKKVPSPSLTPAEEVPMAGAEASAAPAPAPAPPAAAPALPPTASLPAEEPTFTRPPATPSPRISITIPSGKEFSLDEPAKSAAPPAPKPAPPAPKPAPIPSFELKVEPEPAPPPPPPPPPPAPKPAAPAAEKEEKFNPLAAGGEGKSTQFIPPAHLVKKTPGIGPSAPPPVGMSADEAKRHDDAKRFARLLVSEIKLYNEGRVNEGRRGGSIYDKLKDDIDRSRQMYDERIPEDFRAKTNYFYDELVRVLADGKPELLGL